MMSKDWIHIDSKRHYSGCYLWASLRDAEQMLMSLRYPGVIPSLCKQSKIGKILHPLRSYFSESS